MKKILLVVTVLAFGLASCKKEDEVKPAVKAEKSIMAGDKKDLGSWD